MWATTREQLARHKYRPSSQTHLLRCGVFSHTNHTDTYDSQSKVMSLLWPIETQLLRTRDGTKRWARLSWSCSLLSQLRCSNSLTLPRPSRTKGLHAASAAEGGRPLSGNSQAGSHLNYWQYRRHHEFNNTSAILIDPS